jgi:hypothetical protein
VRAIEALGLIGPGKPDHHHHRVSRAGDLLCLGQQSLVISRVADPVAGSERHLAV